jgi:hypothetical protein
MFDNIFWLFLEARARGQTTHITQVASNPTDVEMTTSSESSIDSTSKSTSVNQEDTKIIKPISSSSNDQHQSTSTEASNPCVLCLTEEKRLACIPCGHLATCVPCGHSLQVCPICRRKIEAFVRIYI